MQLPTHSVQRGTVAIILHIAGLSSLYVLVGQFYNLTMCLKPHHQRKKRRVWWDRINCDFCIWLYWVRYIVENFK